MVPVYFLPTMHCAIITNEQACAINSWIIIPINELNKNSPFSCCLHFRPSLCSSISVALRETGQQIKQKDRDVEVDHLTTYFSISHKLGGQLETTRTPQISILQTPTTTERQHTISRFVDVTDTCRWVQSYFTCFIWDTTVLSAALKCESWVHVVMNFSYFFVLHTKYFVWKVILLLLARLQCLLKCPVAWLGLLVRVADNYWWLSGLLWI